MVNVVQYDEHSARRRLPQRRAVVLVIMAIAALLLGGILMFVLNTGHQINRRIQTQTAADATASAAATWIARSMNTIAMNNVGMARYLAAINNLDATPQATEFALIEQTAFRDILATQIHASFSGDGQLNAHFQQELANLLDELNNEVQQLSEAHGVFQTWDIRAQTHYNGGQGAMWQAMTAMDQLSQTTLENLAALTHTHAMTAGQTNLPADEDSLAIVLPIQIRIPAERGSFDDFRLPVSQGILPISQDDPPHRRGPFDALFGWRDLVGDYQGGTFVRDDGGSQVVSGGGSGVPIGSGVGPGTYGSGAWVGGTFIPTGYRVYGPHQWLLRTASWDLGPYQYGGSIWDNSTHQIFAGDLRHARFYMWLAQMANVKLNYCWAGQVELADIRRPDWRTQSPEEAEALGDSVYETGFIIYEMKSRYPVGHAQFLTQGTYAPVSTPQPRLLRTRSESLDLEFMDPRTFSAQQISDRTWRDEWTYEVAYDYEIGLIPETDDAGEPIDHTVYRYDHFIYVGVNVGEEESVENPYAGLNRASESAPAPILLNHDLLSHEPEDRWAYLTILAVAQQSDEAQSWPAGFNARKPHPYIVASAQATVFNNHSWDLWTQMWQARMQPVSQFDLWANAMNEAAYSTLPDTLDVAAIEQLSIYFNSLRDMGEIATGP